MVVPSHDNLRFYRAQYVEVKNEQATFEPIWREIRDYLSPRTARFLGEKVNVGTREDAAIINTNPRFAVRTLAAGMQSGITSPMRPWFRLGTANPDLAAFGPIKEWLESVEIILRDLMIRSNIYDRLKSNYGILGTYGTSALWLDDDEEELIRGHDLLMGSFYAATNSRGEVDTMYRRIDLTAAKMLQMFGDRVKPEVKIAFDNGHTEQTFCVIHVVHPNPEFKEGAVQNRFKKFASVWMNERMSELSDFLKISGYDNQPFMVPRWDVIGNNTYGVGSGELALGDAKQLQLLEKRKLQGIDKNIRPPMIADSSMRNSRTENVPGGTTYINGLISGQPGYRPAYQINPMIGEMRDEIVRVEGRIDEAFHKNLFLIITDMADQPNITATQINALREEKLLMLGPVLERLNNELLDPLIDRFFDAAFRKGLIPDIPPELAEAGPDALKVEYVSVLAQAQKALGIGNMERFINFTFGVAEGKPEVLDKIDADELIEQYGEGVGISPRLINPQDEVDAVRAERARQQNAAATAEATNNAATAAKTLSQADTSGTNALTDLQGGDGSSAVARALELAGGA